MNHYNLHQHIVFNNLLLINNNLDFDLALPEGI